MSQWSAYGSCSVTCELGEKTRERTCDQGDCSQVNVPLTETEICDEGDCIVVTTTPPPPDPTTTS